MITEIDNEMGSHWSMSKEQMEILICAARAGWSATGGFPSADKRHVLDFLGAQEEDIASYDEECEEE